MTARLQHAQKHSNSVSCDHYASNNRILAGARRCERDHYIDAQVAEV